MNEIIIQLFQIDFEEHKSLFFNGIPAQMQNYRTIIVKKNDS